MTKQAKANKQALVNKIAAGFREILAEALSTKNPELQTELINQVWNTLWSPPEQGSVQWVTKFAAVMEMLKGIRPQDGLEDMLATQMVGTHYAAMECLRRAMIEKQTIEGRDQNLKHAAKLLAVHTRQLETLNKHRGKGQQKVTVEHVHVGAGGQAIVGNVQTSEPRKGAKRIKLERPSLSHDPAETVDIAVDTVETAEPVHAVKPGEAEE